MGLFRPNLSPLNWALVVLETSAILASAAIPPSEPTPQEPSASTQASAERFHQRAWSRGEVCDALPAVRLVVVASKALLSFATIPRGEESLIEFAQREEALSLVRLRLTQAQVRSPLVQAKPWRSRGCRDRRA